MMKASSVFGGLFGLLSALSPSHVAGLSAGYASALLPVPAPRGGHQSSLQPRAQLVATLDTGTAATPLIDSNFPDPAIIQDSDGTWYAFATNSGGIHIQVATASAAAGPWTLLDHDALPTPGNWTTGEANWAPDVRIVGPGQYVLYYSAQLGSKPATHCVGTATATTILGPYVAAAAPFSCPVTSGGAIDASGFFDTATGRRWVVYKVDGNSLRSGGPCGNGAAPYVATPLLLQEVNATDGVTPIGNGPTTLLNRTASDGPLIEAPNLVRVEGSKDGGDDDDGDIYVLFYSSHCYNSPEYNVLYATARNVTGPYERGGNPLFATGNYNLTAPGGATSAEGGGAMVFHADCTAGRCMFGANFSL